MMEQQLTKREVLIEKILHLNDTELKEVADLVEALHGSTNEEIRADEALWDSQFAMSQDQLAKLADEAIAEHHSGKTRPFAP
jgi:hypothetical protein